MYCKIALGNIKRSLHNYTIYFLTLMLGICIFYLFNALESQSSMLELTSSKAELIQNLVDALSAVSVFVAVILGFLVVYANRFLIHRRKKEFGIYLTLGMNRFSVAKILLYETIFVGMFSLGVGLLIGIFLSQGMAAVVANLLNVRLSQFHFVFSPASCLKTISYFAIIDGIVLVWNIKIVTVSSLMNLIYGEKKNEMQVSHLGRSVILFVFSILLMIAGYIPLVISPVRDFTGQPLIAGAGALIGSYLFFRSLSGMVLWIKTRGKGYLKNLNMVVIRQIAARVRTTSGSMAMISLLLAASITMFCGGLGIYDTLRNNLFGRTPFDVSILARSGHEISNGICAYFEDAGLDLKQFSSKQSHAQLYKQTINGISTIVLSQSECNQILSMENKPAIELKEGEFAVISNDTKEKLSEKEEQITVFGKNLTRHQNRILNTYLWNMSVNSGLCKQVLVVHDSILKGKSAQFELLNFSFANQISENDFRSALEKTYGDDYISQASLVIRNNAYVNVNTREGMYGEVSDLRTAIIFVVLYVATIMILSCATILSLQQLTQIEDSRNVYVMLEKLGADQKMINQAIFRQISFSFLLPLILAVFHAGVGILSVIPKFIPENKIYLGTILVTVSILFVLYGGYYFVAYQGAKSIYRGGL